MTYVSDLLKSGHTGALVLGALLVIGGRAVAQTDALPSWNDGPAKQAIVAFVTETTDQASPKFVPPAERIATFDQDGTLWVEHPMYTFVMYALDRVPAVVKEKPELAHVEPFKTVLSGNREAMAKLTTPDLEKIMAATYTGMTVEQFEAEARQWLAKAKDPRWHRLHGELTYQPMQEVLQYLRDNGYQDLHRHRRWTGLRAFGLRADLRHPTGARGRYRGSDQVRPRQERQADAHQGAQSSCYSMTLAASPRVFT